MTHPDKYPLLSRIDTPADLRKLKLRELPQLCRELRADILDELSQNPGHLASSLGTVELTVALHYVFGTPHVPHNAVVGRGASSLRTQDFDRPS